MPLPAEMPPSAEMPLTAEMALPAEMAQLADMTQADLPPLVQRVLERLIRAFAPERVILFGSYAKDTVHDRSDVDLLVVANIDGNPDYYQRRARQLAADSFPPIDIVLVTPTELTNASMAKSPFLLSILTAGVTLYERPR